MKVKVHLVDGTYELYRAFYGTPPKRASDGAEMGAVRGPSRFAIGCIPDTRPAKGIDPDLYSQFGPAEDATRALGMVTWPMIEFEADDAIATAALRFAASPAVEQVVICSPDKDLTQCVNGDRIVCRDRMRGTTLTDVGVVEKFGVPPASIPDWLALVGDSADGFPGIARWGAKSAAAVLAVYKKLEAIPDDPNVWTAKVRGAAVLADNLRAGRANAELFRTLATLRFRTPANRSTICAGKVPTWPPWRGSRSSWETRSWSSRRADSPLPSPSTGAGCDLPTIRSKPFRIVGGDLCNARVEQAP